MPGGTLPSDSTTESSHAPVLTMVKPPMLDDPIASELRTVLTASTKEAQRLDQASVLSTNLLLGVLSQPPSSSANSLLSGLGVDTMTLVSTVLQALPGAERASTHATGAPPYAPSASRALEHAMANARQRGAAAVTSADLLLGLLKSPDDAAATALTAAGATLERVQDAQGRPSDR
jgi:ATP-dependent Clp protease ATP-binding subunit ClpA